MAKSSIYKRTYSTVSQPGTSLATGFLEGLNKGMTSKRESEEKMQQSLAPKMMEIQARYNLQGMKQQQTDTKSEKRDLQRQLQSIQKFYKAKKFSLKEKMAEAEDDGDIFSKSKGTNPKVAKLQELYSQVEDSEMEDTKEILDQLKQYYK